MCSGLIPAPPVYITEHGVLWNGISVWLLQVSCPRYVPSQLHVHLLTDRVRETEKLLTQDKGYLTIVKKSVCYWNCSHTRSKTTTASATRKKINFIPENLLMKPNISMRLNWNSIRCWESCLKSVEWLREITYEISLVCSEKIFMLWKGAVN